ncbi:MAG: hypothetical protein IJR68_07130, partial [Fretibacterium sp.]|nr:hypothetical protein [Fretibacterium sp.]
HHVNVAAELTAGITYAPVITAVTSSTPDSGNDANENGTSGSGGGGGCDTGLGLAGIAALGLTVLATRKRR